MELRRVSYFAAPGILDKDIVSVISEYFRIDRTLLLSKTKKREVVEARQIGMYILLENEYTQAKAGELFNRDHATALHAFRTVENIISYNQNFSNLVADVKKIYKIKCQLAVN